MLALKEADVMKMLAASTFLGTQNADYQMLQYAYKRKKDGIHQPARRTYEKLLLAARAIVSIENPADVYAISARHLGQRAVLKYSHHTGARPSAVTPGCFTNQIQGGFREPRLLIVTVPACGRPAHLRRRTSTSPSSPSNTDSPSRYVDIMPSRATTRATTTASASEGGCWRARGAAPARNHRPQARLGGDARSVSRPGRDREGGAAEAPTHAEEAANAAAAAAAAAAQAALPPAVEDVPEAPAGDLSGTVPAAARPCPLRPPPPTGRGLGRWWCHRGSGPPPCQTRAGSLAAATPQVVWTPRRIHYG